VLTPPTDLSDSDLEEAIGHAWGVPVASLEYHAVGFGSHHRVATDNQGLRHFVTVDELSSESHFGDEVSALGFHLRRALEAATDLRALGCSFVVAPITTKADEPFIQFSGYSVALYPFIEGRILSFEEPFGKADRDHVLAKVLALHRVPISAVRPPDTEGFVVPWLDQLDRSLHLDSEGGLPKGPYAAIAAQLLVDNEAQIRRLISRYRALVAQYLSDPAPVVITHGEIHPGNVMETSEGWVIVDWDTVLLAPPERDLWRLAQGDGSVLREYGDTTGTAPTEWLVEMYGIRWDLGEIASFAAEFREPHEDTGDSRKALEILRSVLGRLGV
jgi:spectinomycin phosphotransferase/16S rRNA (guanine(1405)-N(7))-methyltransferase